MAALFGTSDDAFRGAAALHEATARYLMQWLQDTRAPEGAWRFYREWRDGTADDPKGTKAFERIVGRTPEDAESEWEQWVEDLRPR